ncbi:helix-turn-helix domain-containing protein [Candidatus Marsarchaeota archaeon]|nr:helix-turn-helix domain-containing protein [Candidatus Marsarchaeota archaeon]
MRIVIRTVDRVSNKTPSEFVKWLCEALGLAEGDSEGKAIDQQILEKLIVASRLNTGITSSEIGKKEGLARSTVIYHLNRLIGSGLVVKKGRVYYLRAMDVASTLKEMEYDIDREMSRIQDAAKEFDRMLLEQMKEMQSKRTMQKKRGGFRNARREE